MMHDFLEKTYNYFKQKVTLYSKHQKFTNYILYGNIAFIGAFTIIAFLLTQGKTDTFFDIKSALSRLEIISYRYNQKLIEAQIKLSPDIKGINNLLAKVDKEHDYLKNVTHKIGQENYTKHINKYIKTLSKRLIVKDELINRYKILAQTYQDYLIIAQNAENIVGMNTPLQLSIKKIMLDIEKVRLMAEGGNRDFVLKKINHLQSKLLYQSPIIQEKLGLFTQSSTKIIQLLRYLDTIRHSINSDAHDKKLSQLHSLTSDYIGYEYAKFASELVIFLIISIILMCAQFAILTLFFLNKRQSEKIKENARLTTLKSNTIAERAKNYVIEAQKNQFKLLNDFCGDFNIILSNITQASNILYNDVQNETTEDLENFKKRQVSITTINESITALNRWLKNYLELHIAQESWPEPNAQLIDYTQLFDTHFYEARFFIQDTKHLMSIYHGDIPYQIKADSDYILKLFLNMIYISLKWSQDSFIKSSISVIKPSDDEISETEKDTETNKETQKGIQADSEEDQTAQGFLCIEVINGACADMFEKGIQIFEKDASLGENTKKEDIHPDDRFILASLYFIRQISDILNAKISYEKNIMDENALSIQIPVALEDKTESSIGVPVLYNKNILVISAFPQILNSMKKQLDSFGLNVTILGDKYAAIGHIIGGNNDISSENKYDLFIIDHHPPEIDAEALTKIIRENSPKNLAHILVISTEDYIHDIQKNSYLYDAYLTKPVMPVLLKSHLEECVNIQLYGVESNNIDLEDENFESDTIRCLTVMDDGLSAKLLQLILSKENIEISIASSSEQIFEMIENQFYNFILISEQCDWITPANLAKDIRRHHSDNKNSVLILFYDILRETIKNSLIKSGYDDFVQLPVSQDTFLDLIDKWEDPTNLRLETEENKNTQSSIISVENSLSEAEDSLSQDDTEIDNNEAQM